MYVKYSENSYNGYRLLQIVLLFLRILVSVTLNLNLNDELKNNNINQIINKSTIQLESLNFLKTK